MAARARQARRRPGRTDSGASWISYSDMMAALLLVFVLVLCYSIYQYFLMLETKTAELDQQSALLTTQQTQLETQKATLDAQQGTLAQQQTDLAAKQSELDGALAAMDQQKGQLLSQNLTLEEQEAVILAAQAALQQKETDLATAQASLTTAQTTLAEKQTALDAATALLTTQQTAMSQQQQKLDDLVGVRTQIIQALSAELSKAQLKASVDKNTGDIMLESAVFFDVGRDEIKESGQALLNDFIPVYLSVLLRPEYVDFLGEIVIEGHTDTQGAYLKNLQLSQERALSVATYCLGMPGISEAQREMLRNILTAKGRSYSDPVLDEKGRINMDASRRVEFKFRLKDSEMIDELRTILAQ